MITTHITLLSQLVNLAPSLTVREQIQRTNDLISKEYDGINPFSPESVSLGVYDQMQIAIRAITHEAYKCVRYNTTEIDLLSTSFLGYSKDELLSILEILIVEGTDKEAYIPSFTTIADKLSIGPLRTMLMLLVLFLVFGAEEEAGALAFYLHITCNICYKGLKK